MLLHFINWTNYINCKVIFSIFYLVILFQIQRRVFLLRVTQLQSVNLRIKRICYVIEFSTSIRYINKTTVD